MYTVKSLFPYVVLPIRESSDTGKLVVKEK